MPRARVVVNLHNAPSYDVLIGDNVLAGLGTNIQEVLPEARQAVIISDSNVAPLYGQTVKTSLAQAGLRTIEITLPAGEESKSLEVAGEVFSAMADQCVERDAVVVALGGGVVGDLAGFVAATYMRGISLVHVPTTLLAMVDSSIGGKTGVNLEQGKNLVGAFLQPSFVCADIATLSTLPEREWLCGFGEVAKTATLAGDEFFFWLLDATQVLCAHDLDVLREAITRCVVFKANVVASDETERNGNRSCLNYGHTLGHALEKIAGYGEISHGQAVAEGMRFAARLAVAQADASMDFVHAQDELLDSFGFDQVDILADVHDVLDAMLLDKKVKDATLRFVLVNEPGNWQVSSIAQDTVLEHLDAWERAKQ